MAVATLLCFFCIESGGCGEVPWEIAHLEAAGGQELPKNT